VCGGGLNSRIRSCVCEDNDGKRYTDKNGTKCNFTSMNPNEPTGPEQDQSCNEQPCIPCDNDNIPVVSGSSTITNISVTTSSNSAYFTFSGANIAQLSVFANTYLPKGSSDIPWDYSVDFTSPSGSFTVKIPLESDTCNRTVYFVVKAVTDTGAVGYGKGLYSIGSYGSAIECVNFCAANPSMLGNITSGIQYGVDGITEPIQPGNNVVGGPSSNSDPFETLKILYIVLPLVAFILTVAISAILLRKKFSQMRSAESSEEDNNNKSPTKTNNTSEQKGSERMEDSTTV